MENRSKRNAIMLSVLVYFLWLIATYLLEGRNLTLLRPEATEDRIIYTIIANFIAGTIIAAWVLRSNIISDLVSPGQIGFDSLRHTIAISMIGGIIGFIFFVIQNPPSLNPIVIMNVYAQVLTVSVAEVVVCWAVIGAGFESLTRNKGRAISLLSGILAASISFGIYHFAHSPPFNQLNMVLLLTFVGLATSLVYFTGRNIYATIVFHNTLALFGVMQALEKSGNLITYNQPLYRLFAMAFLGIIVLAASDILIVRRKMEVKK